MASPSFPSPVSTTVPASGILAAPAYATNTFPSAATYHPFPFFTSPAYFPSRIPTQFDPNRPPLAAIPIHDDLHGSHFPFFYNVPPAFPYAATDPYLPPTSSQISTYTTEPFLKIPDHNASPADRPILTEMEPVLTAPPAQQNASSAADTRGLFSGATSGSVLSRLIFLAHSNTVINHVQQDAKDTRTDQTSAPVHAEEAVRDHLACEIVRIKTRLLQQEYSLQSIQGEITRLSKAVACLATSMGMQTTEAPVTGSSPPVVSTQFTSPTTTALMFSGTDAATSSSMSSPSNASATAYVVPQKFSEMPQSYGFDNLNRKSIIRADGTEHSYFTLPEDYPLERVVPRPVFPVYDTESDGGSIQSGHVFIDTPERVTYEEEQHENSEAPKYFRKPIFSPEKITASVFSLTDEQKPDNVKPQQVNNQQWHVLMTEAGRKEWDPGTLQIMVDVPVVVKWSSLEGLTHTVTFSPNILICMIVYAATPSPNIMVSLPPYLLWDPGDTKYHALFTTAVNARKLQCADVYKSAMIHILAVQFGARTTPIFESSIMCSYVFGLERAQVNLQQLRDPLLKALVTHARIKEWDPGVHTVLRIKDTMLDKCVVPHQVQFVQDTFELSLLISEAYIQYYAPNGVNSVLHGISFTLQRDTHFSQGNYLCSLYCKSVLKTEYCSMRGLWKFSTKLAVRLQWDPGVPEILHSYTATHPIDIRPAIFTHVLQPVLAYVIKCSNAFGLGWTEINATVVLVLVDPCSGGKFLAKHSLWSCQMVTIVEHIIIFPYCATKSVHVTKCKYSQELLLMAETLQNLSEFKDGQLACMLTQGTSIKSCESVRHTITLLSFWSPSFEMAKLQWDPRVGIFSSMYLWLQGWTARIATVKPLLGLQISELVTWQRRVTTASYVWDPGTVLLQYKSIWLLWLTEEKENAMHYCQIFQRCTAMSSQFHRHGIPLWLINFQVP